MIQLFIRKLLIRKLKNDRGITTIEFALLAPVLFLLLLAIIELGLIAYISSTLEGATAFGARIGKTGFVPAGQTRADFIQDEITRLTQGLIDPADVTVRIIPISTFSDPGTPCPAPPTPCSVDAGSGGDIVLYETTFEWTFFTPMLGQFFPDPFVITAITPVRNEDF